MIGHIPLTTHSQVNHLTGVSSLPVQIALLAVLQPVVRVDSAEGLLETGGLVGVGVDLPGRVPHRPLVTLSLTPLVQTVADDEGGVSVGVDEDHVVEGLVLGRHISDLYLTLLRRDAQ